jgi:hypothetical protein
MKLSMIFFNFLYSIRIFIGNYRWDKFHHNFHQQLPMETFRGYLCYRVQHYIFPSAFLFLFANFLVVEVYNVLNESIIKFISNSRC